jgi:hypothetical protein
LAREVYPDITLGLYSDAEEDALRQSVDVTPAATHQLVTDPVQQKAPEESLDAAVTRWTGALFTAATVADCDKVAREMKGRLTKGTQVYDEMVTSYKQRVKELKAAPEKPTVQEGEIVSFSSAVPRWIEAFAKADSADRANKIMREIQADDGGTVDEYKLLGEYHAKALARVMEREPGADDA